MFQCCKYIISDTLMRLFGSNMRRSSFFFFSFQKHHCCQDFPRWNYVICNYVFLRSLIENALARHSYYFWMHHRSRSTHNRWLTLMILVTKPHFCLEKYPSRLWTISQVFSVFVCFCWTKRWPKTHYRRLENDIR